MMSYLWANSVGKGGLLGATQRLTSNRASQKELTINNHQNKGLLEAHLKITTFQPL